MLKLSMRLVRVLLNTLSAMVNLCLVRLNLRLLLGRRMGLEVLLFRVVVS